MNIEAVDFFYLAMPHIEDIGDGSQDTLLVRVAAGGYVGWGECEASPLVTIAAMLCPMSHSACKPVLASVLGQELDTAQDIQRINRLVSENSMDVLQADHALSGIDIAMWDVLGQRYDQPIYNLLGYAEAYPKTPYASMLFGDTPQETWRKAQHVRTLGFRAAKFGWGHFGRYSLKEDADHIAAAREGLGQDSILCIDAGTVWGTNIDQAKARMDVLTDHHVTWLEEPFHTGALHLYNELATSNRSVKLAGGEGAHNEHMARHMIDYAGIDYIQIDTGRIGGITPAKRIADYAATKGVTFVNHTFTSHLALSASIQPYVGLPDHVLCEYPVTLTPLAAQLTTEQIVPDENGDICLPEQPGLGLKPNLETLKSYLVDVQIVVNDQIVYQVPQL